VFVEVIAEIQRSPYMLATMGMHARQSAKSFSLERFLSEIKGLYEGMLGTAILPAAVAGPTVSATPMALFPGEITRNP
jgi:hypothetical protein